MTKKSRFELGHLEKTRRSIYVFLRDQLEHKLISIALESPYRLCRVKDMPYPYVEPGDLQRRRYTIHSLTRSFLHEQVARWT